MQAILSAFFLVKMKDYLPNLYIFSAALILIISLGLVVLASSEFYNVAVLQETDFYPFGSEGPVAGMWQYENEVNYITFTLIEITMGIFLILLVTIGLLRKNIFLLKCAMIAFPMSFILTLIIQGNYFKIW